MKLKGLLLICVCFFMHCSASAQLNFIVGYNAGSVLQSENNDILEKFNTINNGTITEPFNDLKFITGLELGFRYNFDPVAMTINFSTMRRRRSATQLFPMDQVVKSALNYSMGMYSLGIETGLQKIRIGSAIGYRRVKIKSRIGSSSDFKPLVQEGNWVTKFYMTISARGNDFSSIAIRPYFDWALGATDISIVNSHLGIGSESNSDSFHTFGITIVFYNGPQNLD